MNRTNDNINNYCAVVLTIILSLSLPLKAQTNSDGSSPQFLYPEFSMGSVKMKNGSIQTVPLNYNTVSEKMVFERDGNLYDMISLELVDTVFLQNSKFVQTGGAFYEILFNGPVTMFIQHKNDVVRPGTPSGYGGTSQVSATTQLSSVKLSSGYYNLKIPSDMSLISKTAYWVRKDGAMDKFLNERQFLKLFPDNRDELKQYIKSNRIKFTKKTDLIRLVEYCNNLSP